MSLRIPSNQKTSQGILIAPLYSYPNSSIEASSIFANRGWLRTLASITNLIRISFPTYTGRDPLGTTSFFLVTEHCLLFSFFFNLINANGGLEEWISKTLCSKQVNWHILDEITRKPTFARLIRVNWHNLDEITRKPTVKRL